MIMEAIAMQRHWFPGGNTARGFHSFYDLILQREEARRIILLKGGPGVGKSTFMRRIAQLLEENGQRVEYLHCSSDPKSLDGVVCREIGFAMLDGTAPHIVDPEVPGAADSILNLGVFLNEQGLSKRKKEIIELQKEIRACFSQGYRYLSSALPLREDSSAILRGLLDEKELMRAFAPWLETVTSYRTVTKPGMARPMFASAITPEGCVCYLSTLALPRIWRIEGAWASNGHQLLSHLRHAALVRGMHVEAMYCPMQPERLEHLHIPTFGLFITTDNKYHTLPEKAERVINFDAFRTRAPNEREADVLRFNGEQFDRMIDAATASLRRAKELHDALEAEYVERMDFEGVERCFEETRQNVMALL